MDCGLINCPFMIILGPACSRALVHTELEIIINGNATSAKTNQAQIIELCDNLVNAGFGRYFFISSKVHGLHRVCDQPTGFCVAVTLMPDGCGYAAHLIRNALLVH